tara:strand:- start:158 stop:367 length:210 start_codon:yes stop_codon:yes gene_type:complete
MIQEIYKLTSAQIIKESPRDADDLDHPFYDGDGEPCPGWYVDFGSPGCLPDGTIGPYDTQKEAEEAAEE